MIALDYCHKIKCYFNGMTEDDVRQSITIDHQPMLRQMGLLFEEYWQLAKANKGRRANH